MAPETYLTEMTMTLRKIVVDSKGNERTEVSMTSFVQALVTEALNEEKTWEEFWDGDYGEAIVSPQDFETAMEALWEFLRHTSKKHEGCRCSEHSE